MPYFFVRVILSDFDALQIRNGISVYDLRDAIKKIHPNRGNKRFDRALTVFLNRIGTYQKNHGITPSTFDYDTNLRRPSMIDPNFFFFVRHYDHQEFLEGLKLPLGFTKDDTGS